MEHDFNGKTYLDLDGLSDFLPDHPSKKTIYYWCLNNKIPYTKLGGKKLFFDKAEVINWVELGRPEK